MFSDADLGVELPEELFSMMPSIETICLFGATLSEGFLQPNPDGARAK